MVAHSDPALAARIETLERQVRELLARIAALEGSRSSGGRAENRQDRDTVREKVSYDWQK
ncbi:MAG: hypothetical protein L3K10_02355 [Thermoplasmata archaeon]|nr:hypothetical protein [Thermoplasmata archaeon]